jgi:glutathione S-transferase
LAAKWLISGNAGRRWHDVLRGYAATAGFNFFRAPGLATHPHRHHCLAALRVDNPAPAIHLNETRMYKLYSMRRSGNSYKVRLALALLDAPYQAIEIDILRGESRTPDFLAKNPSGQVPLLEVAEGRYLAESNAILWYVAGGTSLAPESRIERAEALQWMFFEQHALEPNIGAAYFWLSLVKGGRDLQTHALEDWMERGYGALQVMENHLKTHDFFAASQLTVADIALYGYTHVADQCDFDLAAFPAIGGWLRRVQQTPGYVAMDWRPDLEVTDSAGIAANA